MKYLKTYENFDFELAVGDYVLVNYDEDDMEQELKDYLKNNIAQVRYGNNLDDEWITVNYKDTPSDYLIKHYLYKLLHPHPLSYDVVGKNLKYQYHQ